MKERFLLLIFFLLADFSIAQPGSFFLDPVSGYNVVFAEENIYYYSGDRLTKTDYTGSIIWSKEGGFNKIIVSSDALYGLSGNMLIKTDTAGNLLWAKEFSDPFCAGLQTQNTIYDLAYDGRRIYLSAMQPPAVAPPYPPNQDFHPAVIVLDSGGQALSVVCDSVSGVNGTYQVEPCIGSLRGGAWLSYHYSGGINSHSRILRADTNGIVNASTFTIDFGYGFNMNNVQRVIPMPDSTYLALGIGQNYMPVGGVAAGFHLLKFDESGNVLWCKSYYDPVPTMNYTILLALDITCDSSNHIYAAGTASNFGVYGGNFIMKLNPMGNIMYTKLWQPDPLIAMTNGFPAFDNRPLVHYKNETLYCMGGFRQNGIDWNTAILAFDTALNHPCFSSDSILVCASTVFGSGSGTLTHFNSINSYYPDTLIVNLILSSSTSADLCMALPVNPISHKDVGLTIYPSPAKSAATIQYDPGNLFLFNTAGKRIVIPAISNANQNEWTLDLSALPAGIYYIRLSTNHTSKWGKLVKT